MKNCKLIKKEILYVAMAVFFTLTFTLAPVTPFLQVKKAEAHCHGYCASEVTQLADTAIDKLTSAASIASKIFDGITSNMTTSLWLKEFTLDKIAWSLINTMIQQMSKSIVQWINSGFQGSPAFVQNLGAFLLDVADITAGKFLTDLGLGSMCTPFKLNIQLALAYQYQASRSNKYTGECRLSQVVGNVENFLSGDMVNNGGWGGWLTMTTIPSNNMYGALAEATAKMEMSITNAKGQQIKMLDFGRGFKSLMSIKSCDVDIDGYETDCGVTTPGAVIESQLNNVLDSGRERLIVADEINEILSALYAQLVQQAFTGVGGLLGLTSNGYSPSGFSYIQAATSIGGETVGLNDSSRNPIAEAITVERSYIGVQQEIIALVDGLDEYEANRCGTDCITMPSSLENARTNAVAAITATNALITRLQEIQTQYTSETDPDKQLEIMQGFLTLQASGSLHNPSDAEMIRTQTIGNEYFGLIAEANTYRNQIDEAAAELNRRNNQEENGTSPGD